MTATTPQPRHIGKINHTGMLALAKAQLPFFWQMKEWWISDMIFVPMYMVIVKVTLGDNLYQIGGLDYITYMAYGLLVSTCFIRSFECAAYTLVDVKMNGVLPSYIQAPMGGWEFMAVWNFAYLIYVGTLALCLSGVLLLFGMASPQISVMNMLALVLFCIFACGLGHGAALLSQRWDHIVGIDSFIILPVIMLSGVFFPPTALPDSFAVFYDYNPFFLVIDGLRQDFSGSANIAEVFWMVLIMSIIGFGASVICWERGYGVKL